MENKQCHLTGEFSIFEKIYAQVSFFGIGILGTIGIILVDWHWVVPYIFIFWYGIPGIIQRHLACPRCPHLYKYGDCLQVPPTFTKFLIINRKQTSFTIFEKVLFYLIFFLIPIYPIYWLWWNKVLFFPFVVSVVIWYSGQFFYFCKRCRVKECPFNRVTI